MNNVLVYQLILKRDLEYSTSEVGAIFRAIRRPTQKAMHTSRNIAFVVTTEETSKELVDRLGPVSDVGAVEDVWCFTAPDDIASSRGGLDSLEMRVRFAKAKIGKWNNPKYVRQGEVSRPVRRGKFGESGEGSATVKMAGQMTAERRFPHYSNRPKRETGHNES